jgi:hypothetical protein
VITTKGHGGFMFTKDDHLKAVYSSDIDAFLEKLEVLEQFNQGKFACKYCKEVITRNNLYAIIPMPNKNVDMCCNRPDCVLSLSEEAK